MTWRTISVSPYDLDVFEEELTAVQGELNGTA
jgi:hypothetical protein